MRLLHIVVITIALTACKTPGDGSADDPTVPQDPKPATEAPTQPPEDEPEPITCKIDADCPTRACGPCTPGEVVMQGQRAVSCAVNPCTNHRSVCSPEHVCVVHPDTKMVEDLKSEECQKLQHFLWSHPEFLLYCFGIVYLVPLRIPHEDAVTHHLHQILIAGNDNHIESLFPRLVG